MRYTLVAAAVVLGALSITSCKKEPASGPASVAQPSTGHAKGPLTFNYYALTEGSKVCIYYPEYRTMKVVSAVVDDQGGSVDGFTGIAWDQANNCTWLVTGNHTTNPAHRCRLWRAPGGVPYNQVSGTTTTIYATALAVLTDQNGAVVRNAKDIELRDGTIYMLRSDPSSLVQSRISRVDLDGHVQDLSGTPPAAQAFTVDGNGRFRTLVCNMDPYLSVLDDDGNVSSSVPFGTNDFVSQEAGIAGTSEIYGVNFATNLGGLAVMATSNDPSPQPGVTHVFPTIDIMWARTDLME